MPNPHQDWLGFVSSRLSSQIAFENARKARLWALALLGFFSLGFALNALGRVEDRMLGFNTKVIFLIVFHPLVLLGHYLPSLLQKGEKPLARFFSVRDFFSLTLISSMACALVTLLMVLSFQVTGEMANLGLSGFFAFAAWANALTSLFYFCSALYYVAGLMWFPGALIKLSERSTKAAYFFLGHHGIVMLLQMLTYPEAAALAGSGFFEPLRIAGLFWISCLSLIVLFGKILNESAVPALSNLELDIASGKLTAAEPILSRIKETFVLKRLVRWIGRISSDSASKAQEIARCSIEAVGLVDRDKPSELDLRQVEDRTKRAEQFYKKLEKGNQRFLVSLSFFDLGEIEREKTEELKDQFSRELRNAKLELASTRKKIDDKLVALKNTPSAFSLPPARSTSASEPTETVPTASSSK